MTRLSVSYMYVLFFYLAAGLHAKESIDHGNLVPDDIMVDLITNELHTIKNHSWLLDGRFVKGTAIAQDKVFCFFFPIQKLLIFFLFRDGNVVLIRST